MYIFIFEDGDDDGIGCEVHFGFEELAVIWVACVWGRALMFNTLFASLVILCCYRRRGFNFCEI